jgi:hypothetical protein
VFRPAEDQQLWRKSSYTRFENCIELSFSSNAVAVRDSKDPEGPVLSFSSDAFGKFLTATKQSSPAA